MVQNESGPRAAYSIPARYGDVRVMLIDYDKDAMLLEHYRPLPEGHGVNFVLEWGRDRVSAGCRIVASERFPISFGSNLSVYRTRVAFSDPGTKIDETIGRIVRQRHQSSIALQLANASGQNADGHEEPVFRNGLLDSEARIPIRQTQDYVRMTWDGTKWVSSCTTDPSQPRDGFTVDAEEPPQQIQRLCEAYEKSLEDGRALIRAQAMLALEGKRLGRIRAS